MPSRGIPIHSSSSLEADEGWLPDRTYGSHWRHPEVSHPEAC